MNYTLKGFDSKSVTLKHDNRIKVGAAVMLKDNYTVYKPSNSSPFCGICTDIRGDYATVALKGFVTGTYSGTAPTVGYQKLSSDGNGGIVVNETEGREFLVFAVNESDSTIEFIL